MTIIIYDFEVFKYDTLLGTIIIDDSGETLFQTWDLNEIKSFYELYKDAIWIGHNNWYYDDLILEAIVNNKNPFEASKAIINSKVNNKCRMHLLSYDLMNSAPRTFGLKLSELLVGKSIDTTEVDFNLDRKLNEEEKLLTEKYNQSDLNQTIYNFKKFYDRFKLRLDIISEFNLPIRTNLSVTGTQLAANVLKAKRDPSLIYQRIAPKLYDNLRLENEELKEFYLSEKFRIGESKIIKIGNAEITFAAGGAHSAEKKYHSQKLLYLDVSGYYNLIMINYDLLPRTMDEESKKLYEYMYHEQLRLKKINPVKRAMYKTILLSVFGAMNNEHTDFYDPWKALLVTTTGELFIADLIEKLKDYCTIVQTNTDGLMVEPFDWQNEEKIVEIVDEWQKRTGFVIKREYIYDLFQRDVNCYVYKDDKGEIVVKGEAVKNYDIGDKAYATCDFFNCKEPPIVAQGIVNSLLNNILPENFVEQNKENYILFQYGCRKNTYDYLTYDLVNKNTFSASSMIIPGGICRVFASKDNENIGMINKHKFKNGKESIAKVASLPANVFIYNKDLTENIDLKDKIDYQYYVERIYERLSEFI